MINISYYISKLILKMQIAAIKDSEIHPTSKVAAQSALYNVTMGRYSDIGYNCFIVDTQIGSFCSLGANIRIGGAGHPLNWVSTSQVFVDRKDTLPRKFSPKQFESFRMTQIGNDVWIGDNALIKGGVKVGTGAVIGMGSVVTKDVPDYAIVGGNPAKIIRYRFESETIDRLISSKWWEMPEKTLDRYATSIDDVEDFLERVESNK